MKISGVPAQMPHELSESGVAREPTVMDPEEARLREVCSQLEGIFLQQLMKALRDTVPESGLAGGGAGEEIFSSLLDEHISTIAAGRLEGGISAALYRQLQGMGGVVK